MDKNAKHFTEGERIYLKQLLPQDVTEEYVGWLNDPEINQFLELRFEKQTLESVKDYVDKLSKDPSNLMFGIFLKENDKHIGNIKIGSINNLHKFAEIGFLIGDREMWGKGYASEAIKLASDYGFQKLKLHKIYAGCYSNNMGSAKALQKAGFEIEGVRKKMFLCGNEYVDDILLGKLTSD